MKLDELALPSYCRQVEPKKRMLNVQIGLKKEENKSMSILHLDELI